MFSDDEFSLPSQSLMSHHKNQKQPKNLLLSDNHDEVDLDSTDDETGDLELIQPKDSNVGRCICAKMYLCSVQ